MGTASPEPLADHKPAANPETAKPHGDLETAMPGSVNGGEALASEAPQSLHAVEETGVETGVEEPAAPAAVPEPVEEAQPVDDEAESRILPRS